MLGTPGSLKHSLRNARLNDSLVEQPLHPAAVANQMPDGLRSVVVRVEVDDTDIARPNPFGLAAHLAEGIPAPFVANPI